MEKVFYTSSFIPFLSDNFKLLSVISIIILIYYHCTKNFDCFKKCNVKYIKPVIFFGSNVLEVLTLKSNFQVMIDLYNDLKGHAFGGYFEGSRTCYILRDPELIKTISVVDAEHFLERNTAGNKEPRYRSRSLLLLKPGEWKAVRSLVTPAFSSSRLKSMFPLVQTCCNQLVELVARNDKQDIDLQAFTGHLSLEVTGVCAFGISTDALEDENAEYYKLAASYDYMSISKRLFFFSVYFLFPSMIKYVPISILNDDANSKLVKIIQTSKAQRVTGEVKRCDLLQLLVDAAMKEKEESLKNGQEKIHLDDDTVDAQALLFLHAGFATTCTLLTCALCTLTVNPEMQDKLRAHILDVTKGEDVTYDQLVELDYLESFLNETLRMYPPIPRIDRKCCKPYVIPGTDIRINVGDVMIIPVAGLHMDPDIFPEPHIFKPDRFMKNGKLDKIPDAFQAFGTGPKSCIGRRFSMIVSKLTMVSLLTNFKFTMSPKTIYPFQISTKDALLKIERGAWARVDKIKK